MVFYVTFCVSCHTFAVRVREHCTSVFCCSYAYLECANEKTAYEMSEKYKDTEINGEKLYVIQAISEKKNKFG